MPNPALVYRVKSNQSEVNGFTYFQVIGDGVERMFSFILSIGCKLFSSYYNLIKLGLVFLLIGRIVLSIREHRVTDSVEECS